MNSENQESLKFTLAKEKLAEFINSYKDLPESQKFALGGIFDKELGGKLSPYNSPDVVCVLLVPVEKDGQLGFIGVRRAIPPCVGEVALPGGFLNRQEDPATGAVREFLEETGISVSLDSVKIATLPKMGHNNHTLVFFESNSVLSYKDLMDANTNLLTNTDREASELVFIDPNTPLCFPLHQNAVNETFKNHNVQPMIELGDNLEFKTKKIKI